MVRAFAAGQVARVEVGMVLQFLDGPHDPRACRILDDAGVVQHAGDGRGGHFGAPGHLFEVHVLPHCTRRGERLGRGKARVAALTGATASESPGSWLRRPVCRVFRTPLRIRATTGWDASAKNPSASLLDQLRDFGNAREVLQPVLKRRPGDGRRAGSASPDTSSWPASCPRSASCCLGGTPRGGFRGAQFFPCPFAVGLLIVRHRYPPIEHGSVASGTKNHPREKLSRKSGS